MKRLSNLLLVLCFILLAVSVRAQNTQSAPATDAKPKMEVQQSVFDAGTVYRSKDKLEHAFVIKNTGKSDLKILIEHPG